MDRVRGRPHLDAPWLAAHPLCRWRGGVLEPHASWLGLGLGLGLTPPG